MSDAERPDVIQGRLGWESGDVSEADPSNLEPHPKNDEIYGDTTDLDETFVESIREKGVLEPLVITEGKRIISGHRRCMAAREVGLDTVPVRYAEFDSELAEREALVEFNRQREKTPGQVIKEAEELLEIQRRRGRDRMAEGGSGGVEGSSDLKNHESWKEVAETVGVSEGTLSKGFKVKEKAEGGDETAQQAWEGLQTGEKSIHGAYKKIEKAEAEEEVKEQREAEGVTPTIHHADALDFIGNVESESVDLLLTDPPYSTDVDDVYRFAKSWLPPALETVRSDGYAFVFVGAYPDELHAYLSVLNGVRDIQDPQVLVWTYRNTLGQTPSDRYKLNWQAILFIQGEDAGELDAPKTSERWAVQDINAPDGRHGGRYHKWQKPTELVDRFVRHATEEGDTVLDPFAGTGTVPIVAARMGRDVLACDSDREMLEFAADRGCIIDE